MSQRQAAEHPRTFEDQSPVHQCPECKSYEGIRWDTATTVGKQGMKFRDYFICKDCLYVWQWVVISDLFFKPKEQG